MNQNPANEATTHRRFPLQINFRRLRAVRAPSLNLMVVFALMAALLPVAILSLYQIMTVRETMNGMIAERLVASASVTALEQREPITMARRLLESMSDDSRVLANADTCSDHLAQRLEGREPILNFARWSREGRLVCSAITPKSRIIMAESHWWTEVLRIQRFVLSQPFTGQVVPKRMLLAVEPIVTKGRFDGAVTAAIDLSRIERSLEERRLSPRALVGIADAQGQVLTASSPTGFSHIDIAASRAQAATLKAEDGADWIYAAAPLHDRQLFIFYAEPEHMALSLSREQFRVGLFIPTFAILLSCFAAWLAMDRFVLRWLRRVAKRSQMMAHGDYRRYPSDFAAAPRELRHLGKAIDIMAGSIAERDLALRRALVEKDAMAREVNHRVKNNLQMISSLVSLQAERLGDPKARQLMAQTRLRIGALALVHRLIYELDGSERGLVDTERLFRELCVQLEAGFQPSPIRMSCRSDAGSISGDHAVAAALIVVEAVTNAFRHGFPNAQAGQIHVCLKTSGSDAVLTISDDGIGALDAPDQDGMGQDLMRALTQQLDGTFNISRTEGGGRTVTVCFSVSRMVQT